MSRSTVHRRKSLLYILMRLGLVNLSRLWGTNSCIKVWDPWVQRILRWTFYRILSKMSNQYHAYPTGWCPCSGPRGFASGRRWRRGDGKGQAQWEDLQKAVISWFISLKLMQIFVFQEPKSISCELQANRASFPLQYTYQRVANVVVLRGTVDIRISKCLVLNSWQSSGLILLLVTTEQFPSIK